MSPRAKKFGLDDINDFLSVGLTKIIARPSIHGYKPHDKQIAFHSAREKGRLYIGGNRSGKTVGGIVEDVWRMKGTHPYQDTPPAPTRGRICTVSYTEGIEMIIIPELAKWLPPSDLINGSWEDSYNKNKRMLTLNNGSTCELMSYDQAVVKFAGTSRHWIHFDEEPPKPIFDECRMRLVDTGGKWYITMTPVDGMTWVYDDIYLPGQVPGGGYRVIEIDSSENPYISNAELELVVAGLDGNEKKARKEGKFVQIGGLVYSKFSIDNVIPSLSVGQLEKIRTWTHYGSLDHGLNNPTAWLWHAAGPNGFIITYDEIYKNETLIHQFAKEIHERNALEGRQPPAIYVGDPAIAQRNAQTGDSVRLAYTQVGIPIVLGNNNVSIRVEKMNRHLENRRWLITEDCPNLIRELQRVRWKVYANAKERHNNNAREEIHKKDDHAPDSAGYFFSLMPDLHIPITEKPEQRPGVEIVQELLGAVRPSVGPNYYDRALTQSLNRPHTEWTYIDEHMGGEW